MPKQFLKIDRFEGGINSRDDPRDIAANELSECTNMVVDSIGRIITMGGYRSHSEAEANVCDISAGKGLFVFNSDYDFPAGGTVTSVADDGSGIAVFTTSVAHNLSDGDNVLHTGFATSSYNGHVLNITVVSPTSYKSSLVSFVINDAGGFVRISRGNNAVSGYLVVCDTANAEVDIYSRARDAWYQGAIPLDSGSGYEAIYYSVDGVLRVVDAGLTYKAKWFGYIKRTHFDGTTPGGSADDYDSWYSKDNDLAAPTRGLYGGSGTIWGTASGTDANTLTNSGAFAGMDGSSYLDAASNQYIAVNTTEAVAVSITSRTDNNSIETDNVTDWTGDSYRIFPYPGTGFNVNILANGSGGDWLAGTWEFAITFIYDGNQESKLFKLGGSPITTVDNDYWNIEIWATSPYNPRITGGRLYIREWTASSASDNDWYFLVDINLEKGCRTKLTTDYVPWVSWSFGLAAANEVYLRCGQDELNSKEMSIDTYESLNGFLPDEISIALGSSNMGFKGAVVSNRRVFAIHPKMYNEDSQIRQMPDRIIYSPPNRFDTFPTSFYMDIGINDGDEFVAIAAFADRLLAFKKRRLYIINISQATDTSWFLESEHDFLGVRHPAAVFTTEYGVVWVNENGVYYYNGSKITNLSSGKLDDGEVNTFMTSNSMIGFIPKRRQLIVNGDCSSSGSGNIYLYDFKTNSWVYGSAILTASVDRTNFVVDWNNDLVYMETDGVGYVRKWQPSSKSNSGQYFTTRDYDFGMPNVYKKIYAVYLTYKSSAAYSGVIKYATNGSDTFTLMSSVSVPIATDWSTIKITPASSISCLSLKLQLNLTAASSTFELNSMVVEYRILPLKRVS